MNSLPRFRPATQEEVATLTNGDIGPGCSVLALDNPEGKPDLVVLRQCLEVDPMYFADTTSNRRKALLMMLLENMLSFTGVQAYYFNIHEADVPWRDTAKQWGATEISTAPEFRYKKELNVHQDRNKAVL